MGDMGYGVGGLDVEHATRGRKCMRRAGHKKRARITNKTPHTHTCTHTCTYLFTNPQIVIVKLIVVRSVIPHTDNRK